MRRGLSTLAVWLFLRATGAPHDDSGGASDEALITAGLILAAVAFLAFVTVKVVPWIQNLELPVPG